MNENYWNRPFKVEIITVILVGSTLRYSLDKASQTLTESSRIVGLAHRTPQSNAYTLGGKKLVDVTVFDAAFLNLKSKKGDEVLQIPLSLVAVRTGGDNNFFRIPEGVTIDFRYGKSFLELQCPGNVVSTASSAGQAFELMVFYTDDNINC